MRLAVILGALLGVPFVFACESTNSSEVASPEPGARTDSSSDGPSSDETSSDETSSDETSNDESAADTFDASAPEPGTESTRSALDTDTTDASTPSPLDTDTADASRALVSVPPFGLGDYAVAMSNFELSEEGAALSSATISQYLEGFIDDEGEYGYLTELFAEPDAVLTVNVAVPDTELYGELAGSTVPVAYYVAYPTSDDNARDGYLFPYADAEDPTFVHMDPAGETPLVSGAQATYPVIISSHGYGTHALWDVTRARELASHGYIVVVPFHGEKRFLPLDDTTLPVRALRALAGKAVLDHLIDDSAFGPYVDLEHIGVSGHSFGAVTALALMGGNIGLDEDTPHDPRVRAGFGASSWVGAPLGPDFYQFGPGNIGLESVTGPFFCIYGSADTVAPPSFIIEALSHLPDTTYAVEFMGQPHVYTGDFWGDRINWELLYFRAYLQDDAEALELLRTADSIEGMGEDHQRFEYQKTDG